MAYRPDPNNNLSALSLLASAADKLAYFTGAGAAAVADLTSLGRTFLAASTEAAMRAVIKYPRNYTLVDPAGGGDYTTIQAALTAASANEQIVVLGGTYTENLDFTGVPDGVRLNGSFNGENVIVQPASDASPTVLITGSHTIREFTVRAPATGSQPGISVASGAGKIAVIYSIVAQGQGGSGDLLRQNGSGICAILGGFYHNGGTVSGAVLRFSAGSAIADEIIGNVGQAADFIKVDGGSALCKVVTTQLGSIYALTDFIDISSGTIEMMSHQGYEADPAYTNGLHISGDGVTINLGNVHLHSTTWDILVDAALSGTNTNITTNACDFKQEKYSNASGDTWFAGAVWTGNFVDTAINDDPATRFVGELAVGQPPKPVESCFGTGDSTTIQMLVYTDDGTGTSFIDVTSQAASPDATTFTVQGTGTGQATIYFASGFRKFTDIKLSQTVIANLGSGAYVAEVWTGAAWTEIDFMQSESVSPFNSFAKAAFTKLNGRIHLDTKGAAYANWATNDPPGTGTNRWWGRLRNTAAITTGPTIDRVKVGYDRLRVTSTGLTHHMGDAVYQDTFWTGTGEQLSAPSGGANAPATANITVSSNVTYQQVRSKYSSSQDNRAGTQVTVPFGVDTSKPLTFILVWTTDGTSANDVQWDLYVTEVSVGATLNSTTIEQPVRTVSATPGGIASLTYRTSFAISIPNLVPGDDIAFNLWRRGSVDTNPDDAIILKMSLSAWFWE